MRKLVILFVILFVGLLSACHLPTATPPTLPATTPTLYVATATVTLLGEPCAWVWSTHPLPELSAQLKTALQAAGLSNVTARAEVYGENCLSAQNEVLYFTARQTDFYVTILTDTLANPEQLGQLLERVLAVLDKFPPEATPGAHPGSIGISFLTKGESLNLWFTVQQGIEARARGLRGAALLEALKNP
ncbi:MAG: hypothetical protein N2049_08000 [Anaerolineales bacterium]|nr:hypothetical protein [Anaerolineales bacterium]MCX7609141.1 hypothetical protein [Anaerolineales bacterium]MDW8227540.1 hypothetical protein [Anaerolineales bacterium]